ncbi:MAG TPA: NADH-quinone oxidoreductase subunit NuoE [Longimicrobiales bacterium]|nr:NADH-quinone oxidoreductase subunit NuoE [Longimicrobiales bacterium]
MSAAAGSTEARTPVRGNPGHAGETGQFEHLTEADVRGTAYVGQRPTEGGHPGGACSYPYQVVARDPEGPLFTGPYRERLDKIISRYPNPQGALLPALGLAQEIRGHVSADSMAQVAEALGLSPTYVRGVATFYTMYNKRPVGDYLIQVCTNVACNLCGADEVMQAFLDATDSEQGEITPDGLFTVMEAECLGACGFPTAVQINERYYENVEAADVPALLDRLRAERDAAGGRTVTVHGRDEAADAPSPGEHIEVPDDPGAPGETIGPEANPYSGEDSTPPAAARPPASDKPADQGQD